MRVATTGLQLLRGDDEPAAGARPTSDDAALCRAFLDGDEAALGPLLQRHQALLFRVLRRYARSPDDARDLAQRTFLQAIDAVRRALPGRSGNGDFPFTAWLVRIAINLGKNHLRDTAHRPPAPLAVVETPDAGPGAQQALEAAQRIAAVRRAVLNLPERQRAVFALRIDAGLPFAEVARALDISEGNARAHFHQAVKRLKAEVTE